MRTHLIPALLAGLLFAGQATTAESRFDETQRFLFYSIAEGLYEDGVSTEDVERILMRREGEEYFHFIYACPVCKAAIWAFDAYRLRPDKLYSVKSGASNFGFGVEKEISQALQSDDVKRRLTAINTLIEGWIERRMDLLRLTEDERAELTGKLEEKREQGASMLNQFRAEGVRDGGASLAIYAPAYVGQEAWECAVCRAAVGQTTDFREAMLARPDEEATQKGGAGQRSGEAEPNGGENPEPESKAPSE